MTQPYVQHEIVYNPDGSVTRYSYVHPSEGLITQMMREIFEEHWQHIVIGPWLLGAVFELPFEKAPKVTISNGYLNIDAGPWHCHLCIGPYKGKENEGCLTLRRAAKIAFYDWRGDGSIKQRSSGIRLWNGYGEQMTTIFFPHVLRGETPHTASREPNWENLRLYYEFRERYLGEPVPENLEQAGTAPLTP